MRQAADELRARAGRRDGDVRRQPQHQRLERLHRRLRVLRLRPGPALARRLRARPRRSSRGACARRSSSAPPRSACSRASTPTGRLEDYEHWLRVAKDDGARSSTCTPTRRWRSTHMAGRPAAGRGVRAAARRPASARRPGTAAEVLHDGVRERISPNKLPVARWVEIIEASPRGRPALDGHGDVRPHRGALGAGRAHARGARAAGAHRRVHRVRAALVHPVPHAARAARTGSRRSRARRTSSTPPPSGWRSGRTIPSLQASWVKMGLDAATEALRWGVNDLGGTLMEESISRMAGSYHGVQARPRGPDRRRPRGRPPGGRARHALRDPPALRAAGRGVARTDHTPLHGCLRTVLHRLRRPASARLKSRGCADASSSGWGSAGWRPCRSARAFWDELFGSAESRPLRARRAATARCAAAGRERGAPARRAFASRMVARGEPGRAGHRLPLAPRLRRHGHLPRRDGGGFVLVSNSETLDGGASALRFGRDGEVARRLPDPLRHHPELLGRRHAVGHLAVLRGDRGRRACGSATRPGASAPWRIPRWASSSTRRPRSTRAARRVYLTEDLIDGGLYRFTPSAGPTCRPGCSRSRGWRAAARSSGSRCPTRSARARAHPPPGAAAARASSAARASGSTATRSTWRPPPTTACTPTTPAAGASGWSTTGSPRRSAPLLRVDQLTGSRAGEVFVCEDIATEEIDMGVIERDRERVAVPVGHRPAAPRLGADRRHVRPDRHAHVRLLTARLPEERHASPARARSTRSRARSAGRLGPDPPDPGAGEARRRPPRRCLRERVLDPELLQPPPARRPAERRARPAASSSSSRTASRSCVDSSAAPPGDSTAGGRRPGPARGGRRASARLELRDLAAQLAPGRGVVA